MRCGVRNFTHRSTMVDSVVSDELNVGMTRSEVQNLLGNPDESGGNQIVYHVGPERNWMSVDYEVLILTFFETDKLLEFVLHTD